MTTWEERMTPAPRREPRLELVETVWQMRSQQKATRILECGVYRTDVGLEVRCGYGADDLLYSMAVAEIGSGRELAEQLRLTVVAKGGFEALAP